MYLRTLCTFLCAAVLLAGCKTPPVDYPPLSFTRFQPIYMSVSRIDFVEEYKSSMRPPYVEHLIPYSPAEAMKIWMDDRLRTMGGEKKLEIIIKNGSVTSTTLPTKGLASVLTINQDKRYDAKLDVELRIYGNGGMSEASVNASARQSVVMPENASANQREVMFRKLISDLMLDINAELEKNMYAYMGNYISYSQNP